MSITMVLADDQPLILIGLEQVFAPEQDFRVLARCTNGQEALHATRQHRPDVLVLELHLPVKDGLLVLHELRIAECPTRVVVLTATPNGRNGEEVIEAMRLGARGVVLKEMPPQRLIQCIRKVHAGGEWIETCSIGRILERIRGRESGVERSVEVLTARELEIARLAARGLSNEAMAKLLSIGVGTIKIHLHHVYDKLGLNGRLALLIYGRERGWG